MSSRCAEALHSTSDSQATGREVRKNGGHPLRRPLTSQVDLNRRKGDYLTFSDGLFIISGQILVYCVRMYRGFTSGVLPSKNRDSLLKLAKVFSMMLAVMFAMTFPMALVVMFANILVDPIDDQVGDLIAVLVIH